MSEQETPAGEPSQNQGRKRIRQTEVPSTPLTNALRVAQAIAENYAKRPTRPIDVAAALNMTPSSGGFRTLCGASIGYGLTAGGSNAQEIVITDLGMRIVSPLAEGDDADAQRQAVLTPTVQRQFLEDYDGASLPPDNIAQNVLEKHGVPPSLTDRVYRIILANAEHVGFVKTIKDKQYIDLGGATEQTAERESVSRASPTSESEEVIGRSDVPAEPTTRVNRRVYVSTGPEKGIAEQLDQILRFGGLEPVLAGHQSPASVAQFLGTIDEMESCSSAVIHAERFDVERPPGIDHLQVELQITVKLGAALALYGDRFVVLAEKGVRLPKELSDLHVIHYSSDGLGINDMMTIAKALEPEEAVG